MNSIANLIENPIRAYPLATVACFDPTTGSLPRRQLDLIRTKRFLESLAVAGAPALLIGASTGHGHLRQPDELLEWFECASKADLGDAMLMALLRPEDGSEINNRLISALANLGYQVIFVRPGNDLPCDASDVQVVENMQGIVRSTADHELAVGLYSIPDVSGLRMSSNVAATLVDSPGGDHIVAVKVTEADYDTSTKTFLEHPRLQHLKIVQGWDPHIARALREGGERCGVTSGPMSFAIFQYLHILESALAQQWQESAASQDAVTQLFEAMQDDPTRFADLQRAKFVMGLGHPLLGEVNPQQIDRLLTALSKVDRVEDRSRLARSLDLMQDGPYHEQLATLDSSSC